MLMAILVGDHDLGRNGFCVNTKFIANCSANIKESEMISAFCVSIDGVNAFKMETNPYREFLQDHMEPLDERLTMEKRRRRSEKSTKLIRKTKPRQKKHEKEENQKLRIQKGKKIGHQEF